MCGFFITNNPKVTFADEKIIEASLRFRGPDCASGLISHNGWKAYHSRLSIIEPATGNNQPMLDNTGGLLVFNGEILNYKELGSMHFNREFTSDTSLLSALLESDKLNLSELDGFFSFVYITGQGEIKNAVRDSFGVKPLFCHEDEDGVSFSSEPNVFKRLFNCEVNNDSLEEYFATRAPIFSGSYFKGVSLIDPGTCYVSGGYFDPINYLELGYEELELSEIESAIKKGLQSRLVSDVPVGLLLSRGIDSNLLRKMGDFDRYYSIGFDGDEDIEFLKKQNIKGLHTFTCSREEYKKAFNYLLDLRQEPMSVPNEVLLYLVSKKASSDGIKVLLSGEGADEFFGGYDRVFKWASESEKFDLDTFLEKYCYLPPKKNSYLYCKFQTLFSNVRISSAFEVVRWFFIRYHMPILFRRLDFSLMAAGVEGREPIANMHTFVKAVKLSPDTLMHEVLGKVPLRHIISKYMGDSFAFEKKVGFPVDLTKVFDNEKELSSYELWFEENIKVLKQ